MRFRMRSIRSVKDSVSGEYIATLGSLCLLMCAMGPLVFTTYICIRRTIPVSYFFEDVPEMDQLAAASS